MSVEVQARLSPAARRPAPAFLHAVEALHPFALTADARGIVSWASAAWRGGCERGSPEAAGCDLRDSIPRLPQPEQAFALMTGLRERGFVLHHTVAFGSEADGGTEAEFSIFPVVAAPGEPPLTLVVARRHEKRQALPERSPVLESCAEGILAIDLQGFVTYANPALEPLTGIDARALVGAPALVLTPAADDLAALAKALRRGEACELELQVGRGEAGADVTVSLAPQRNAVGDPEGMVACLRPAKPRSDATLELQRRNDELEHCVNALAHDLRSPLVALLGFSRLLRQDYGERLDETGAHFLDRIEQAGHTMEEMIHDLLELSRIGRPGEQRGLVEPRGILMQLKAELKARLDADGIELSIPEQPPLLYCDRTRLYQVFSNLIGNAIDHMGACDDRRVLVEISEQPDVHHIRVRDFGRGIDPKHHERIFDVLHSMVPHRERGRGTGMGLAIVRKVAETHGGRAWVESRQGEGATFHVTLPRK